MNISHLCRHHLALRSSLNQALPCVGGIGDDKPTSFLCDKTARFSVTWWRRLCMHFTWWISLYWKDLVNFTLLKKKLAQSQSSIPQGSVPTRKKVFLVVENGLMGSGMDLRYDLEKNLLFQSKLFHWLHRGKIDFPEYDQCGHFQLQSNKLTWSTTSDQGKNPSQPWHCSAFQNLLWHPCLMLILRNWKVIVALELINNDSPSTPYFWSTMQ